MDLSRESDIGTLLKGLLILGVKGMVENRDDGSVLIIAESGEEMLEKFEADINVSMEHGIQVLKIEKIPEDAASFPKISYDSSKFTIRK